MMNSIQKRFSQIQICKPNVYLRAFENHPLDLYVGFDSNNHKSLKYRGKFKPIQIQSTTSIEVQQFVGDKYNTLVFSLLDDSAESLFIQLCQDLANVILDISEQDRGYLALRNRYNQWRRLFVNSSQNLLSEFQIMGLIGELIFLKDYMFERYGLKNAISGWSGPNLTHKDFSYQDIWYEIKTLYDSTSSIKVSSLEQLDSSMDGELVVFKMEKMSSQSQGIRINNLVDSIVNLIDDIELQDLFVDRLLCQGYSIRLEYDTYVFQVKEILFYDVSKCFPKLTRSQVNSAILKATYDISLSGIESFRKTQL